MTAAAPMPKPGLLFLVLTFGVAIAVGAAVIYFGINGQIGAGIP